MPNLERTASTGFTITGPERAAMRDQLIKAGLPTAPEVNGGEELKLIPDRPALPQRAAVFKR